MSVKATKSGNSVSEPLPFVEWSDYNEYCWRYEGEFIEQSVPDIWNIINNENPDCERLLNFFLSEHSSPSHEKRHPVKVKTFKTVERG